MKRLALAWLVLTVLTLASWQSSARTIDPTVASIGVLVVAFVKARIVIVHFMEVGTAPRPLRLACDAWVVLGGATLCGLYLSA